VQTQLLPGNWWDIAIKMEWIMALVTLSIAERFRPSCKTRPTRIERVG
jgi:hypothetical protein